MIQLAQILFILSVLVILHEFGHYITAKWFKVRVEKFYLFMDAGFSLFKKKIGETEWGIGWLPIGGYVKLSGMIDESMDTDQMKQEVQPWEFRAKPAWQRLIIMLGGIIVNILLAIFIYSITFSTIGKKVVSSDKIQTNGLAFGDVGNKVGFKNGDMIVSVDGKKYDDFKFVPMAILFGDKVEIDRDGKKIELSLSDEQKGEIIKKEGKGFVGARFHMNNFFIDSIGKNSNGVERFDEIIAINGNSFTFFDQYIDELKKVKQNDSISFTVKRRDKILNFKTLVDSTSKNGFSLKGLVLNQNYNFKNAFISEIVEDSVADKAGIELKDKIIEINNTKISDFKSFKEQLANINFNEEFKIKVVRKNDTLELKAKQNKTKLFGVKISDDTDSQFIERHKMSFLKAIPEALQQSWFLFKYNIQSLKLIAKPKTGAYTQVKSPVGIARQLPDEWNWEFIWNFTALFSIGLAFMNLLPIPGLDGGHALFTIVEMITGKTLSDKAAGYVQTAGMIILLTLMALTFGKDIVQLVIDKFF